MNENGESVRSLLRGHEIEAERLIAWVRLSVAGVLLATVVVARNLLDVAPPDAAHRLVPVLIAFIVLMLAAGAASLWVATPARWRRAYAFLFAAGDMILVAGILLLSTTTAGLPPAMVYAVPASFFLPVALALGALRLDAAVRLFSVGLLVAVVIGLSLAASLFADPGVVAPPARYFDTISMVARTIMLVMVGVVAAVSGRRATRLVHRAIEDARRRARLERFLPREVASDLSRDENGGLRTGRRGVATVVFVDIRGFTARAESMDPATLSRFLTSFRRRIAEAAAGAGGIVDKYIGDGALIVFGAPLPLADDAARALAFARDLSRRIADWNRDLAEDPVRIGIGLHRGEIFSGVIGDEDRLEFTILGDTVNVASRIEAATRALDREILLSDAAATAAGARPGELQDLGPLQVRGRSRPVVVYGLAADALAPRTA
ncbi:adenylate/guanylate cyclase domain-containing protein [Prosthecomicrobium sp. N25]|uniref:adenylate/guanylate cyclase domain-containing protein n=1 Tax=Prosthecomicrobium sp. N25 TaxID=3129254 RepID=UPI0030785EA1